MFNIIFVQNIFPKLILHPCFSDCTNFAISRHLYDNKKSNKPGIFPCICGKVYRHAPSLSSHKKFECGKDRQFQCLMCKSKFYRKAQLQCHVIKKHNAGVNF